MIRLAQTAGQADDPGIPAPPRDEPSFRVFYQARRRRMIGLIRVLVAGVVPDPEGVAQEGWCKFYPHWEGCTYPDAYLRQCMTSAANDTLRKVAAEPRTYSLDVESAQARTGLEAGPWHLGDDLDDKPWDPELTRALQRLSPKLRELVVLEIELNLGERSVAEIARILGIRRGAAYGRRKRAHEELRRLLPADYPELRAVRKRGRGGAEGWWIP